MARQIITPSDTDPAGWGYVPSIGGDAATADPGTGTTTPSLVQDAQNATASAQSATQSVFLPPAPVQAPMLSPEGYMTPPWVTWFQMLQRRVGSSFSTSVGDLDVLTEFDDVYPASQPVNQLDWHDTPRLAAETLDWADAPKSGVLQSQVDDLSALLAWPTQGWVRGAALTAAASAAPAGGTGTAAGGYDTAVNRDLAIATINNLRTRVIELETRLKAIGIL